MDASNYNGQSMLNAVLDVLDQFAGPDKSGWFTALCPFHDDHHPSMRFTENGFTCMACGAKGSIRELAAKLGIDPPVTRAERRRANRHGSTTQDQSDSGGLTVAELAEAKGFEEGFLRSVGVMDGLAGSGGNRKSCVDIPYANRSGEVVAVRKRLSLTGPTRFMWRRGDHPILYGMTYLEEIRRTGWSVVVEGETDSWTLWANRIPALGVPGATNWNSEYASFLSGLTVYVWHEPDSGGDSLVKEMALDIPDLRVIESPSPFKDASELYLDDPASFKERFERLRNSARSISDIRSEAFSKEARESLEAARPLIESGKLLATLGDLLGELGYAGDPRPAIMCYVAITSRVLEDPLNVAIISPSAAGKNAAIDAVLPFFSESAFYLVRASSPRALVYNDETFSHRIVIVTEADSIPEEGPAGSAVRSLMSDREMLYEVVERDSDGKFTTRKIVKPGPTGLITTSTKPLGDQASTRTLTLPIPDSAEQTRMVLLAQADRANYGHASTDLRPWLACQRWLETGAEVRIVIPFAEALAKLVPDSAVRMRRDFPQLLTVIKSIAVLGQARRDRDSNGRVVASLDDYAVARWLLEDVFATTVNEGLTPAIRQTVAAVSRLASDRQVTSSLLAAELKLSPSTVSYRVRRAISGGWLVNRSAQKGSPADLVVGPPMPDGNPLPTVDEVRLCADNPQNRSNVRRVPQQPVNDAGKTLRMDFEPVRTSVEGVEDSSNTHSKGSSASSSRSSEPFESNDENPGDATHTQGQSESRPPDRQPWDEFLDQEEG